MYNATSLGAGHIYITIFSGTVARMICLTTSCCTDVHYLKATELKSRMFVTHGTRQGVVCEMSEF